MRSKTSRGLSDKLPPEQRNGDQNGAEGDRLYVRTAERIAALIRTRGLKPDERLPPEVELAETLEVSRATVREAIVALDVCGAVRLRRNASAVVRDPHARPSAGAFGREGGPIEILRVRLLIEPESARLAAIRADASACDAMEAAIEKMLVENQTGFMTEFGDRDFHLRIAAASGNSVLEGVIADLWRMRQQGSLWSTLEKLKDLTNTRSRAVFEHMRILQAIRDHAPERAARAMAEHIETTRRSVMESGAFGLGGGETAPGGGRARSEAEA